MEETTAESIWANAQEKLRSMLNTETYTLWFAPIRGSALKADEITLEIPNDFFEAWLTENYHQLIQEVLLQVAGRPLKVHFAIPKGNASAEVEESKAASPERRTHPGSRDGRGSNDNGEAEAATESESPFNPNSTFDTFVVGENNNYAHAAALAVAQAPGRSYNPLFVYSGVGLGKTHLLHAIGQHVSHQGKRRARVTYISSEKFTNEYIDALQNNQPVRFRKKYRQPEVLLIDDIQFLAGKERIQEEFFHTFNALHEARKQIVVTCDRPANELRGLEQRLISRFEWGLVADMQPPDVETRVAILRKKAQMMQVDLPEEILDFLAKRIRTNIRRLEGALIRTVSVATLTGKALTVELVERILSEILQEEGKSSITIEMIQRKVAGHYDLRVADMTSKRRPENIAFPRQIAMYLARQLTDNSLNAVGEAFGGRDHGTVLHACRIVKDRMQVDHSVREAVNHLEKQLLR